MALTETTEYRQARRSYFTAPRLFIRAYFVRKAGDATDYAFSRDFTTDEVLASGTPKIKCVGAVQGNTQTIDPVSMRSDIGTLTTFAVDRAGEISRYVADPARLLATSIAGAGTPSYIEVDDADGYPQAGHVTIDVEDFAYTAKDLTTTPHRLTGITRPARGTTIAAHTAGALVRNGEQLRRGVRLSLFAGYQQLAEAKYGPGADGYVKMEITQVTYDPGMLAWRIDAADIQRILKSTLFGNASPINLAIIGPEHPLTLLLKVLLSTGNGTNGPYDVLPSDFGVGVRQGLIDVAAIEIVRDVELPGLLMQFREVAPQEAKGWIESQILRPLNLVTHIKAGKFSVKHFGTPVFRGTAVSVSNVAVAA
jgi:hypothetical protein